MSAQVTALAVSHAGRTVIRPLAVRRVAEAVVAEAAGVAAGEVRAELADARGALAVTVTTPLAFVPAEAAETLVDRAATIVEAVRSGLGSVTGRAVGRVDVRFSGLRPPRGRRVR